MAPPYRHSDAEDTPNQPMCRTFVGQVTPELKIRSTLPMVRRHNRVRNLECRGDVKNSIRMCARSATLSSTATALSWANPTATDFAGMMIERAASATAPATPIARARVTDTPSAVASFTRS
jgi:hypothetical protein